MSQVKFKTGDFVKVKSNHKEPIGIVGSTFTDNCIVTHINGDGVGISSNYGYDTLELKTEPFTVNEPPKVDWENGMGKKVVSENGTIVLITVSGSIREDFHGVLICGGGKDYNTGLYSECWSKSSFKPYNEPVTI